MIAPGEVPINVELTRDAFRQPAIAPGSIPYLRPASLTRFAAAA